jgi:hypothetical protein
MTPTTHHDEQPDQAPSDGWARWTVWAAGLVVALGAGVATAHGLYEVALAAGTPRALAWLYPLITDGLALVAYATTARLHSHGRSYAWTVVIIAAGLSGLTQASYLAGGVATAPPPLRFAIGAWPAIAAAIVAHLLYLLGTHHDPGRLPTEATPIRAAENAAERGESLTPVPPQPTVEAAQAITPPGVAAPRALPEVLISPSPHPSPTSPTVPPPPSVVRRLNTPLNAAPGVEHPVVQPVEHQSWERPPSTGRSSAAPAADRAMTLAREHAARHGHLPTVTELVSSARVARGTAAAALKTLRQHPTGQHPTGQPTGKPTGKPTNEAKRHP